MISIEAYRAAIGRFHCKNVKKDRLQTIPSSEIALLVLITFLLMLLYGLSIAFSCTDYFMFFLLRLIVILTHGYVLLIISISSDGSPKCFPMYGNGYRSCMTDLVCTMCMNCAKKEPKIRFLTFFSTLAARTDSISHMMVLLKLLHSQS